MDDLEKRISEVVSKKLNDGTIETMIEKQLEKAILTALDDVFGYSGNGKKLLKEKFDSVMVPVIENHDFNQYVVKLNDVLTEIVNNTRIKDNKQILNNFSYLMKDEDIKEIKLSEIFDRYCEFVSKYVDTSELEVYTDDEPSYENVTVDMEFNKGQGIFMNDVSVRFSCVEDKNLEMGIKLYKNSYSEEWRILCIINSKQTDLDILSLQHMNSFEVFLRKIKAEHVSIIIDCEGRSEEVEVEEEPEASWI